MGILCSWEINAIITLFICECSCMHFIRPHILNTWIYDIHFNNFAFSCFIKYIRRIMCWDRKILFCRFYERSNFLHQFKVLKVFKFISFAHTWSFLFFLIMINSNFLCLTKNNSHSYKSILDISMCMLS